MESLSGINHPSSYLLNLSLHYRPSFTKPISSFSLKTTSSRTTQSILRASASSSSSSSSVPPPVLNSKTQKEKPLLETPKPISFLIKSTCVAIFTAALVLARFNQPSIASPIFVKPTVKSVETTENEEMKKPMEEEEDELNDDIAVLKELMEAKVKAKKFEEAVSIIDRMIKIQPLEMQWVLLRAHLLSYSGEFDLAKLGFEQILEKDPLFVDAYHGLIMLASKGETDELEGVLKRIESAMEICKKNEDVRDFKLLVAQIRVIEGMYADALKIYQELVEEEPKDFRPYLCQGIIYTLLKKKGEADRQFDKYRKLVPKEHPYARYFEENMLATKAFSQMAEENQTVGLKR